jgi:hypothetical protein
MSVVSRVVAAIPVRTSTATWRAIADLLAPSNSASRDRLESVINVAAILIAAEYTRHAPIVVIPASGARVRIRTVHGQAAAEALAEESPLVARPCAQPGWVLSLPSGIDDIDEVRAALAGYPGIEVRDITEGIAISEDIAEAGTAGQWLINYDELEHP